MNRKLSCSYCTMHAAESARAWITVMGLSEEASTLCSRTCLTEWAEHLEKPRPMPRYVAFRALANHPTH